MTDVFFFFSSMADKCAVTSTPPPVASRSSQPSPTPIAAQGVTTTLVSDLAPDQSAHLGLLAFVASSLKMNDLFIFSNR